MKKRRKHHGLHGIKHVKTTHGKTDYSGFAARAACVLGGVFLGSQIKKFIETKSLKGTDLFGLEGTGSKYVSSGIVTAVGAAGALFLKNQLLKDVSLGATIVGGAGLINVATGKTFLSLGDIDETTPTFAPALPGIGDTTEEVVYLPQIEGVGMPSSVSEENEQPESFQGADPNVY